MENLAPASFVASSRRPVAWPLASRRALVAAAAVAVGLTATTAGNARAATVYTGRTAFGTAVKSGSYTESFDSLGDSDLFTPTKTFTSGGFSFTASTGAALPDDNDLFGADGPTLNDFELSTTVPSNLTFTFPSGNVTAVGGDFTLLDDAFKAAADTFQLTLSDGTTVTGTSGGATTPFFGFTSATPITSLTFAVPADATPDLYFATVNNFTIGAAVPEPTSLVLAAVGAVGLLGRRRRAGTVN